MASIVVVGSLAFDSIETPFGKAPKILGGSANYFSLAASQFAKVRCVSTVGADFPTEHLEVLRAKGIDTSGIQIQEDGHTFHWQGKYSYDLNEAQTIATALNVFANFEAVLPPAYADSEFVFLGNILPELQLKVLSQVKNPRFVAIDTMNFWIEGSRDRLIEAISKTHALIINEAEIRQLTKTYNVVQAAAIVRSWGPKTVVIKRGEYGAILFNRDEIFSLPGLPLQEVKDPTGAGDTFAGGFMGYLASLPAGEFKSGDFRKAVVYGSLMASFTVQDFGPNELLKLNRQDIEARYRNFIELTTFHL